MSTSNFPFEPKSVHLEISSEDQASELYLVNGAYNLVGQAIGKLSLEVAPGQYHLRQRIGDTEAIQQVDVSPGEGTHKLSLKSLDFPTPAPIIGSPTFTKVTPSDWIKPEFLVGKPGIRLVIRDPSPTGSDANDKEAIAYLHAEKSRLRLETMSGFEVVNLADQDGTAKFAESGLLVLDVELVPGHYVLVQSLGGDRQRCMPLVVHSSWSPRVYLLCGQTADAETTDGRSPVRFDKASIIYWPNSSGESPEQSDLVRLEAARKALARGRNLGGYLREGEDGSASSPLRDPMLALIDACLILKDMQPNEVRQAQAAIDAAAASLGEDFPDVVGLRCAFTNCLVTQRIKEPSANAVFNPALATLTGPPMLATSWRYLLAAGATNERLAELMPAEFIPDTSQTWFIWNERRGSRQSAAVPDGTNQGQMLNARAGGVEWLNLAATGLVELMQFDSVMHRVDSLVNQTPDPKSDSDGARLDPLLAKIIDGLATMRNPLLVDAFGEQELARRVLMSLNLPNERIKDALSLLVKALQKDSLLQEPSSQSLGQLRDLMFYKLGIGLGG